MAGDLEARLDEALAELPPDLREIADRNIGALRRSIEITRHQLIRLLEDESASPQARSTAAWIVGLLRESSLTEVLFRVLAVTREPLVLWEVTKALCTLEGGTDLFRSMLTAGPSDEHRKAAAYALGRMRDVTSTRALVRTLSSCAESSGLRAQAAEALGYIGDVEAFQGLVAATADPSPAVRFWSVFALGSLGDKRAAPLLERLARDDHAIVEGWWTVSWEAASALAELHESAGDEE